MTVRSMTRGLLLGVFAIAPAAQAQKLPPVRPLGPVTQVSAADLFGSISAVRPLANGGVIVNDITGRKLVLLNPDFSKKAVIADTTPETANGYSSRLGGLIAYKGDSSLFIDPQSLSILVIDGKGEVARVTNVPRPDDATFMVGGPFGTPAIDPQGRIVYRGFIRPDMARMMRNGPPEPGRPFQIPEMPDSAPVLRVHLVTRAVDTVGYFKIPKANVKVSQNDKGQMSINVVTNPSPMIDDWAMLPDGRVAMIRGKDYHLDVLGNDGQWTSLPKIPFNWERFDDDSKVKFLDSVKVELEKQRETMNRAMQNGIQAAAPAGGNANMRFEMRVEGGPGGGARPQQGVQQINAPSINLVDAKELPDYRPAFRQGAARADVDGNLWVRTTAPTDAGPIYDVINLKGELVDRVKLPFGRVISGFGPGVVYMGVQDGQSARLEVAKVK